MEYLTKIVMCVVWKVATLMRSRRTCCQQTGLVRGLTSTSGCQRNRNSNSRPFIPAPAPTSKSFWLQLIIWSSENWKPWDMYRKFEMPSSTYKWGKLCTLTAILVIISATKTASCVRQAILGSRATFEWQIEHVTHVRVLFHSTVTHYVLWNAG